MFVLFFDCFRFGLCCEFVGLGVCFSGLAWVLA